MDKLELRHLAPYLPYGLKVSVPQTRTSRIICTLTGLRDNKACVRDKYGVGETIELDDVKPILRPLSLLIKEIEINGEKFVPSSRLYRDFDLSPNYYGRLGMLFNGNGIDDPIHGYLVVNKLFEWHFDVFGLIEKGLAIDINTL